MKRKPPAEILQVPLPHQGTGELKPIGGSASDDFNHVLANQVVNTLLRHSHPEESEKQLQAALAALMGIKPTDEIEGMLAAQMVATHNAAMECFSRAMLKEQTFDGRHENLNQANKLVRSYAALMEALNRHRGKGQQKVTVEHVHVHQGGQAIVGAVQGGGGPRQGEGQAHALRSITHEPGTPLRSADPEREAVPVAHSQR